MRNNLKLRLQKNTALSDIHHTLLDPSLNETDKLQRICDKMVNTFSYPLVWGGLLAQNKRLPISAISGKDKSMLQGLSLQCDEQELTPVSRCANQLEPICITEGLKEIDNEAFAHLPKKIKSLPITLYPLSVYQQCVGILAISTDLSQQNPSEHELLMMIAQQTGFALGSLQAFLFNHRPRQSPTLTSAVFEHSQEGILITDAQGAIIASNPALTHLSGYTSSHLLGQTLQCLYSNRHHENFHADLWKILSSNGAWQGEIWLQRKTGDTLPTWLSMSSIQDAQNQTQNFIAVFVNMSEYKETEQSIMYQVYHDPLTGLANRALFLDRLKMALLQAKRNLKEVAVLLIDLDHFEQINDTCVHLEGDKILQQTASIIQSSLRQSDTLARIGEDKFAVVLQDFTFKNDIRITADRIQANLDNPIDIAAKRLGLSANIGISFYPEDDDAQMLLKKAGTAMHRAKKNGQKRLYFYQTDRNNPSSRRIEMEKKLKNALKNEEFQLYYQPQFDLHSDQLVGTEALLRWRHPEEGLLPADHFISIAEESGLSLPIGEWVLHEVCTQAHAWQKEGIKPLRISANLSSRQFAFTGLRNNIGKLVSQFELDPSLLELELTEKTAMQQVESTLKTLTSLKETGINMSIDDFGTGYSSLNYLKQFPIDRLKIDRSFIADITYSQNNAAIVAGIISMAKCLDLKVIAEGVETEEQLNFLRLNGCNEVQGYLFGHPQPADQFVETWHKLEAI